MPEEVINKEDSYKDVWKFWAIYGSSKEDVPRIQIEVDSVFTDYSFYPEIDWGQYGYRPPEGYQVLGAWRHSKTKAFSFLLDNPHMLIIEPNIQLLLYIVGDISEIYKIESKLDKIKSRFAIEDKKGKISSDIEDRLNKIQKSKSLVIITTILGIFTAIINGFSLYLRKLPAPELGINELTTIYRLLIALIHFSSLLLLLIIILILTFFLLKYGLMLIKKL